MNTSPAIKYDKSILIGFPTGGAASANVSFNNTNAASLLSGKKIVGVKFLRYTDVPVSPTGTSASGTSGSGAIYTKIFFKFVDKDSKVLFENVSDVTLRTPGNQFDMFLMNDAILNWSQCGALCLATNGFPANEEVLLQIYYKN